LGLFLDALITAITNQQFIEADITNARMDAIVGLVEYLYKIQF
jgi:hypothetical protein